ncbi:MAG: hypothetical protein SVZ03_00210 [Spirochaetota bacterium]|nr:hypothetical protein [Spirochaetota bacterium]
MIEIFESIINTLIKPKEDDCAFYIYNPIEHLDDKSEKNIDILKSLNAAFLITLAGSRHPFYKRAKDYLCRMADSSQHIDVARFYINGTEIIRQEIESLYKDDPDFADRMNTLYKWVSNKRNLNSVEETTEKIWSVFFPEATDMHTNRNQSVESLRSKRTINIKELNATPIENPAQQVLFTSNVLLTTPPESISIDDLHFSFHLKEKLAQTSQEPQLYWYDHPIQIGVEPENNEVFYGLSNLDRTLEFERIRGNATDNSRLSCVLSVSVTHQGLQDLAKVYLEEEFAHIGGLKNIDVYVFTEADTEHIVTEILIPAAEHYLGRSDAKELFDIFGVDGQYGRHYSFLKAIAAFWTVFIQPKIKATFKIDLDQSFPQRELVEQSGASAFEHLCTPLWGAYGVDSDGRDVEFGMIAGSLVNECDICKSLFTPDVLFPNRKLSPDEYIFFSHLPQAVSTEAEMITRYTIDELDGIKRCIQRIHVTGGTNGILIDSLRRYRPFTPSFIGRAEDQAYILSTFTNSGTSLAYVHKDGLIMKHDKDSFAQDAILNAYIGKLIGDYIRIIYFTAYIRMLTDNNVNKLKKIIDPFTGSFVSFIPATVVYLRFSLKAASLFTAGQEEQGVEFITDGAARLTDALKFVSGPNSILKQQYEKERIGWELYYDTLTASEKALENNDNFASKLQRRARAKINQCAIMLSKQ